jgi:uncharacterized membrane protein YfcA
MKRFGASIIIFVIGAALFIVGAWLVSELIVKFLKFAIGLFLIFISVPMMLGSVGWWRFMRRGKVTRFYQDGQH